MAARILNEASGAVRGTAALRSYFSRGLQAYPNLKFEMVDVLWGLSSVVFYYKNQSGSMSGEFMELNADWKVTRVVANYNR